MPIKIEEMEYTKGGWVIIKDMGGLSEFKDGHAQIVGDKQRKNIAIIPNVWNNAPADAQRIVDCVNGCEGFNPKAIRDLYEACKGLLKVAQWTDKERRIFTATPDIVLAKQAIAKVEEGQDANQS